MFTYSAFLWFLPLAGVVVLIHLINMFRHRRVEWAAIEFLLAGYRKSRTRILLQQLLLLLLRTLAVVAAVLMFAQPRLEGPLAEWLGGRPTHHIILLDDSYSMNDRNAAQGGTPLFDDVKELVRQIAENGKSRQTNDRISLIRFSKANGVLHGEEPDFMEKLLNDEGLKAFCDAVTALEVSETGAGPEDALQAAIHLLQQPTVRLKPAVYFLSDFRQRNWENPAPLLKALGEIKELGGMVRMIRALDEERPNLTLASLGLVAGIHAADVDLLLDVTVVNNGSYDVDNVPLALYVNNAARQPSQVIPRIKARGQTTPPIRFPVRLDGAKAHRIEVRLPPDAVPNDNRRFLALDVPAALEVLLIAPPGGDSADQYVRVALSPGTAKSGIRVRVEQPRFLISEKLDRFDAIFLLEVPRLDPSAIRNLEEYVESGGGLAFFTGPQTDPAFVRNELFKDGNGLFPIAPVAVGTLAPDFLSQTPDLIVAPHPIFRLFGDGESPLLRNVKIDQYFVTEKTGGTESMRVLASLRGGHPLVVEKSFGKGKTVAFLTTAAPTWNNWGRGNPSFVVVMLELAAWLTQRNRDETSLLIGAPLILQTDPAEVEPAVTITMPSRDDVKAGEEAREEDGKTTTNADSSGQAIYPATHRAGFYEALFRERSGTEKNVLFAVNINPAEGDTRLADVGTLSDWLRPLDLSLESAAGFSAPLEFTGARSLGDAFLLLVVLLLLAETFLAGRILPPSTRA